MSDLGLGHLYSGKVRDLYEVDEHHMLMVASDRMSAFDVVMDEPIANKGRVLTGLTDFWVAEVGARIACALVSCAPSRIEDFVPGFLQHPQYHGRTMLVRRAQMLPLECIVRGRLAGQAYEEYVVSGTVHHMAAPSGMRLTDAFPAPMFTPSTKAEAGHDLNIDLDTAAGLVGHEMLERVERLCLELFSTASAVIERAGLVLADTKFELGLIAGELVVCDEIVTPDSSRIWPADEVRPGETPPSFDKQPFRDWLAGLDWDKTPPPPPIPPEVATITQRRYVEAYERVTGRSLDDWYGA